MNLKAQNTNVQVSLEVSAGQMLSAGVVSVLILEGSEAVW